MKKYLKKSISLFMAFLMVFTSLVFVAPESFMKAEAAEYTSYTLKVAYDLSNAANSGKAKFTIYYRNIKTSEESSATWDVADMKDESKQGTDLTASYTLPENCWPYKIYFLFGDHGIRTAEIKINGFYLNDVKIISGSWTLDPGWRSTHYRTWTVTNDAGTAGTVSSEKNGSSAKVETGVTWNWPKPAISTISWDAPVTSALKVEVPVGTTETNTVTSHTATAYDQYSVKWYDQGAINFKLSEEPANNAAAMTLPDGISLNDNGNSATIGVMNKAMTYVVAHANSESHTATLYLNAYYKSVYSGGSHQVDISNVIYDLNLQNSFSYTNWANTATFPGTMTHNKLNGTLTLTNTGSSGEQVTNNSTYKIPVTAGETYVFSYYNGNATNTEMFVFPNGETVVGEFKNIGSTQKGTVTGEITIPQGKSYVTIRFDANTPGETSKISDIKFYKKSLREGVTIVGRDRLIAYAGETIESSSETQSIPTASKPGYTFEGWYEGEDASGKKLEADTVITIDGKYYAKFTPVKNKALFYDYNGQLLYTVEGDYNAKIKAPANPGNYTNNSGTYAFHRWVNMATGEVLSDADIYNSINDGDVVAKYKAEYKKQGETTTYTATFVNPYDSSYSATVSGIFNSSLKSPAKTPVRASENDANGNAQYSYNFIGWSKSKDGDVVINPGDAFRILDNTTYYACFEKVPAQHKVTTVYGTNTGANTGESEYVVDYGTSLEIANPQEWRDTSKSYVFSHWVDANGNTYKPDRNGKTTITVTSPITLTAVYTDVDIQYHAWFYNGAELFEDQTLKNNGKVVKPEKEPTKDRNGNTTYEFIGWYEYDFDKLEWGNEFTETTIQGDDLTYYARYEEHKWSEITFTKDADSNYEEIGEMTEYEWDSEITPPEAPEKEATEQYAYTFSGWTEWIEGKETAFYAKDAKITAPKKNATYVATYIKEVRKYEVTFNNEDGTAIGTAQEIAYGSTPTVPEEPTKAATHRYYYEFSGWSDGTRLYQSNELPKVTGKVTYTAAFTGYDVYYTVTWLKPTDVKQTEFVKHVSEKYTYNRIYLEPATTPVLENTEEKTGYTWGFKGWYRSDENGTMLKDSEGNLIPYAKSSHITEDLYYVAYFAYIPNAYTVRLFNADGTLVKTYVGGYETQISIDNIAKDSDATNHYTLEGFATTKNGSVSVEAGTYTEDDKTYLDTKTSYTVKGNADLYAVYESEAHEFGNWTTEIEATYENVGSEYRECSCGYKEYREIEILKDEIAPNGQIVIGGNTWTSQGDDDNGFNSNSVAYVRKDGIISILTADVGYGIKSIAYTWYNAESEKIADLSGVYTVDKQYQTSVNYNFTISTDVEGGFLNVTITDYAGLTYTVQSARLKFDETAPTIVTEKDCLGFMFTVTEANEIDEVTVTNANGEEVEFVKATDGDISYYVVGYEVNAEGDLKATGLPGGKYTITASDKAGNKSKEIITIAGEHTESDWIIDQDATCEDYGLKHTECKVCGTLISSGAFERLGHDEANAKWTVKTEPTCTERGEEVLTCPRCEEVLMSKPISETGHEYEEVVVEPTCTNGGYTLHTCKNCGNAYADTVTAKLGHDLTLVESKDPTCETAGEYSYKCSRCDYTETKPGDPANGHDYVEETITGTECTKETVIKKTCSVCGDIEYVGSLEGHKWTLKEKVDPTCTEDGYKINVCETCETEVKIIDRFSRTGHIWAEEFTTDVEPTCTTEGSKSIHCTACSATKDVTVIPANGHDYKKVDEESKDATCGENGLLVEVCQTEGCGDRRETVIEATGEHKYGEADVKPSTCYEAGTSTKTCSVCGDVNTETLPLKEHTMKAVEELKINGTCQIKGSTTYKCEVEECGYTETVYGDYGSHEASDELILTLLAATCDAAGNGVYKCKNCSAAVLGTGKIAEKGHNYVATVIAPTCEEGGYTTYTCSKCGDTYKDTEVEASGHAWETEKTVDVKPTCTTEGSKSIHCKNCAATKETESIEVLGHTETENWIVDKKETCTENGSKHKECTVCGTVVKTESIESKGGHKAGALVKTITPATCKAEGEGVYKCTVCGETFETSIAIDANNHSYSAWTVKTAAGCETSGVKAKTCAYCGDEITKTIPATGHNWKFTSEKTEESNGKFVTVTTYTCANCKQTREEKVETSAYTVTVAKPDGTTSTIILTNGAKLYKTDLPEIDVKEDTNEKTYSVKWTDANGNELKLPMTVSSNISIKAEIVESARLYEITFYNNAGRVISKESYEYGAKVNVPEAQWLSGFTFEGWSDGINTYDPQYIPAVRGDAAYSAVFKASESTKAYYVTFKNETGTKTLYTQTVAEGKKVTVPTLNLTKTSNSVYHYVFSGWYTATDSNTVFDFTKGITENVTVYARFTAVKHSSNASSSSTNATCSAPASTNYKCNDCGYEWVNYTAPANGHSYKEISRDTTADGKVMVTYECQVCHEKWTKTVTEGMADANTISVTVTDSDKNPVEGAAVMIYLGELKVTTAVTNEKGKAYFPKDLVADGTYTVKVTKDGYDTVSGQLKVTDGKGSVKIASFTKIECHCVCHADSFFGKIRRWFTNLLASIFKGYTCCDCGHCGQIY